MPEPLAIRPMQWAVLPDLHDAPDLDATDLACMEDLRAVLARHGKLNRFALHLAHRHFELGPGEVLIERPDPDGRTQHVTVGRLDDEPAARVTTWLLDDSPALHLSNAVYCVCVSDPNKTDACVRHGKGASAGRVKENEERDDARRIERDEARLYHAPVAGHRRERRRKPGDYED